MAVLNKEDFMARINARIGDDTSDEAMTFLEDMTDTFNDMETRNSANNNAEWEKKYNDLDASWRQRYKERFFNTGGTGDEAIEKQKSDVKDDGEEKTFEDLFIEREG